MNDKGCKNGKCNRTACPNRPATCFSSVENAYYCIPCARKINEWLPEGVKPIELKGPDEDYEVDKSPLMGDTPPIK